MKSSRYSPAVRIEAMNVHQALILCRGDLDQRRRGCAAACSAASHVCTRAGRCQRTSSHGRFRESARVPAERHARPVSCCSCPATRAGVPPPMRWRGSWCSRARWWSASIWAKFKANLEADGDHACSRTATWKTLSHFVQAYFHSPTYMSPILVGVSARRRLGLRRARAGAAQHLCRRAHPGFLPAASIWRSRCARDRLEFTRRGRGSSARQAASAIRGSTCRATADRACPVGDGTRLHRQVRGAAMVTLPKVGHDFASPAAGCRSSRPATPSSRRRIRARSRRRPRA